MNDEWKDEQEGRRRLMQMAKLAAFFSGIGINFAVITGICIYAGMKFDDYLQGGATGKLVGILAGIMLSCYCVYREIKYFMHK